MILGRSVARATQYGNAGLSSRGPGKPRGHKAAPASSITQIGGPARKLQARGAAAPQARQNLGEVALQGGPAPEQEPTATRARPPVPGPAPARAPSATANRKSARQRALRRRLAVRVAPRPKRSDRSQLARGPGRGARRCQSSSRAQRLLFQALRPCLTPPFELGEHLDSAPRVLAELWPRRGVRRHKGSRAGAALYLHAVTAFLLQGARPALQPTRRAARRHCAPDVARSPGVCFALHTCGPTPHVSS